MTTTRSLGDAEVFPIGLGAMPLSLRGRPAEADAIRHEILVAVSG